MPVAQPRVVAKAVEGPGPYSKQQDLFKDQA